MYHFNDFLLQILETEMTTDMFRLSYSQSGPFRICDLSPGFTTRVTRLVSNVEQDLLTPPEHTQLLVGFVLLDLQFAVYCFVDHCLSFLF